MKRFAKIICTLIGVITVGLAIDYLNVTRKEGLLSDAVSQCDGRIGSIPVWPLGTEYRITLTSVPVESQLHALAIANQMRGLVGITFKDCEINKEDGERLLDALPNCHLFVEQNGRMMPNGRLAPKSGRTTACTRVAESGVLTVEASPRRPGDA